MELEKYQIVHWLQTGTLLTLNILNGKGTYDLLHGRIVNYEPENGNILFYEDDAKKVENIYVRDILRVEFK